MRRIARIDRVQSQENEKPYLSLDGLEQFGFTSGAHVLVEVHDRGLGIDMDAEVSLSLVHDPKEWELLRRGEVVE